MDKEIILTGGSKVVKWKDKKFKRIGIDYEEDSAVLKAIDEIANKERWSRSKVVIAAVENYLKSRGVYPEG